MEGTMGKIALVEKFVSVQGEGYNTGRQALFIRFAGCNLRCDFASDPGDKPAYCDTPWQEAREKLDLAELETWIAANKPRVSPQVSEEERPMAVLTGGEPTMAPQFDEVVEACRSRGLYVAIETNGTIYRDSFPDIHWVSCSPKADVRQGNPTHGEALDKWDPPEVDEDVRAHLRDFPGEYRYVIGGPDDDKPPTHSASRHYVSPAVVSDGSGQLWHDGFPGFVPGALDRCLEIVQEDPRWRLSTQQHKLWGVR